MKIALLFLVSLSGFASTPSLEALRKANLCNATKEYVSTIRFLREFKALALKEEDARILADKVSLGCNGSFNRFAKITEMLSKVGIDSGTAVKHAANFAAVSDEKAEAFIELFKQTYSTENLDLDALNALEISLEVSKNMTSADLALDDFKQLVDHCKTEKELGLPIPFCAQMAAKVASQGGRFGKPIAEEYIKLIRFISEDKKGPQVDKKTALNVAEKVISYGPTSSTNFIEAYRFAVSKKGLALSAKDAMDFSEKMASRSFQLESKN